MILLENTKFRQLVKVVAIITIFTFTWEQVILADSGTLFSRDKLRIKQVSQSRAAGEVANAFGKQIPEPVSEPVPEERYVTVPADDELTKELNLAKAKQAFLKQQSIQEAEKQRERTRKEKAERQRNAPITQDRDGRAAEPFFTISDLREVINSIRMTMPPVLNNIRSFFRRFEAKKDFRYNPFSFVSQPASGRVIPKLLLTAFAGFILFSGTFLFLKKTQSQPSRAIATVAKIEPAVKTSQPDLPPYIPDYVTHELAEAVRSRAPELQKVAALEMHSLGFALTELANNLRTFSDEEGKNVNVFIYNAQRILYHPEFLAILEYSGINGLCIHMEEFMAMEEQAREELIFFLLTSDFNLWFGGGDPQWAGDKSNEGRYKFDSLIKEIGRIGKKLVGAGRVQSKTLNSIGYWLDVETEGDQSRYCKFRDAIYKKTGSKLIAFESLYRTVGKATYRPFMGDVVVMTDTDNVAAINKSASGARKIKGVKVSGVTINLNATSGISNQHNTFRDSPRDIPFAMQGVDENNFFINLSRTSVEDLLYLLAEEELQPHQQAASKDFSFSSAEVAVGDGESKTLLFMPDFSFSNVIKHKNDRKKIVSIINGKEKPWTAADKLIRVLALRPTRLASGWVGHEVSTIAVVAIDAATGNIELLNLKHLPDWRPVPDKSPLTQYASLPVFYLLIEPSKEAEKRHYSKDVELTNCIVLGEGLDSSDGLEYSEDGQPLNNYFEIPLNYGKEAIFKGLVKNIDAKDGKISFGVAIDNLTYEEAKGIIERGLKFTKKVNGRTVNLNKRYSPKKFVFYINITTGTGILELWFEDPEILNTYVDNMATRVLSWLLGKFGREYPSKQSKFIKIPGHKLEIELSIAIIGLPAGPHPWSAYIRDAFTRELLNDRIGAYDIDVLIKDYIRGLLEGKITPYAKYAQMGISTSTLLEVKAKLEDLLQNKMDLMLGKVKTAKDAERVAFNKKYKELISKISFDINQILQSESCGTAPWDADGKPKRKLSQEEARQLGIARFLNICKQPRLIMVGKNHSRVIPGTFKLAKSYLRPGDFLEVEAQLQNDGDVGRGKFYCELVLRNEATKEETAIAPIFVELEKNKPTDIKIKAVQVKNSGKYTARLTVVPLGFSKGDYIIKKEDKGFAVFQVGGSDVDFTEAPVIKRTKDGFVGSVKVKNFGTTPYNAVLSGVPVRHTGRDRYVEEHWLTTECLPVRIEPGREATLEVPLKSGPNGIRTVTFNLFDANFDAGKPVYQRDSNGDVEVDKNGAPVWRTKLVNLDYSFLNFIEGDTIKDGKISKKANSYPAVDIYPNRPDYLHVKNNTKTAQGVNVSMELTDKNGKLYAFRTGTIILKPGQIKTANFKVKSLPAGEYKVVYKVWSGKKLLWAIENKNLCQAKQVRFLTGSLSVLLEAAIKTKSSIGTGKLTLNDIMITYKERQELRKVEIEGLDIKKILDAIVAAQENNKERPDAVNYELDRQRKELKEYKKSQFDKTTERQKKKEEKIKAEMNKASRTPAKKMASAIFATFSALGLIFISLGIWLLSMVHGPRPPKGPKKDTTERVQPKTQGGPEPPAGAPATGNLSSTNRAPLEIPISELIDPANTKPGALTAPDHPEKNHPSFGRIIMIRKDMIIWQDYARGEFGEIKHDQALLKNNIDDTIENVVNSAEKWEVPCFIVFEKEEKVADIPPLAVILVSREGGVIEDIDEYMRAQDHFDTGRANKEQFFAEVETIFSPKITKQLEYLHVNLDKWGIQNPMFLRFVEVQSDMFGPFAVPDRAIKFIHQNFNAPREWGLGSMALRFFLSFREGANMGKIGYITLASDPSISSYLGDVWSRWINGHQYCQIFAYGGTALEITEDKVVPGEYKRRRSGDKKYTSDVLTRMEHIEKLLEDDTARAIARFFATELQESECGQSYAPGGATSSVIKDIVDLGTIKEGSQSIGGRDSFGLLYYAPNFSSFMIYGDRLKRIDFEEQAQTKMQVFNAFLQLVFGDVHVAGPYSRPKDPEEKPEFKDNKFINEPLVHLETVQLPTNDTLGGVPDEFILYHKARFDRRIRAKDTSEITNKQYQAAKDEYEKALEQLQKIEGTAKAAGADLLSDPAVRRQAVDLAKARKIYRLKDNKLQTVRQMVSAKKSENEIYEWLAKNIKAGDFVEGDINIDENNAGTKNLEMLDILSGTISIKGVSTLNALTNIFALEELGRIFKRCKKEEGRFSAKGPTPTGKLDRFGDMDQSGHRLVNILQSFKPVDEKDTASEDYRCQANSLLRAKVELAIKSHLAEMAERLKTQSPVLSARLDVLSKGYDLLDAAGAPLSPRGSSTSRLVWTYNYLKNYIDRSETLTLDNFIYEQFASGKAGKDIRPELFKYKDKKDDNTAQPAGIHQKNIQEEYTVERLPAHIKTRQEIEKKAREAVNRLWAEAPELKIKCPDGKGDIKIPGLRLGFYTQLSEKEATATKLFGRPLNVNIWGHVKILLSIGVYALYEPQEVKKKAEARAKEALKGKRFDNEGAYNKAYGKALREEVNKLLGEHLAPGNIAAKMTYHGTSDRRVWRIGFAEGQLAEVVGRIHGWFLSRSEIFRGFSDTKFTGLTALFSRMAKTGRSWVYGAFDIQSGRLPPGRLESQLMRVKGRRSSDDINADMLNKLLEICSENAVLLDELIMYAVDKNDNAKKPGISDKDIKLRVSLREPRYAGTYQPQLLFEKCLEQLKSRFRYAQGVDFHIVAYKGRSEKVLSRLNGQDEFSEAVFTPSNSYRATRVKGYDYFKEVEFKKTHPNEDFDAGNSAHQKEYIKWLGENTFLQPSTDTMNQIWKGVNKAYDGETEDETPLAKTWREFRQRVLKPNEQRLDTKQNSAKYAEELNNKDIKRILNVSERWIGRGLEKAETIESLLNMIYNSNDMEYYLWLKQRVDAARAEKYADLNKRRQLMLNEKGMPLSEVEFYRRLGIISLPEDIFGNEIEYDRENNPIPKHRIRPLSKKPLNEGCMDFAQGNLIENAIERVWDTWRSKCLMDDDQRMALLKTLNELSGKDNHITDEALLEVFNRSGVKIIDGELEVKADFKKASSSDAVKLLVGLMMEEVQRYGFNHLSDDMKTMMYLFSPIPHLQRFGFYDTVNYWSCLGGLTMAPGKLLLRAPIMPRPVLPLEFSVPSDKLPVLLVRMYAGMSAFASPLSGFNRMLEAYFSRGLGQVVEDTFVGVMLGASPEIDPVIPGSSLNRLFMFAFLYELLQRNQGGITRAFEYMMSQALQDVFKEMRETALDRDTIKGYVDLLEESLSLECVQSWGDEVAMGRDSAAGWLNYILGGGSWQRMFGELVQGYVPGLGRAWSLGIEYKYLAEENPSFDKIMTYIRRQMGDESGETWAIDPRAVLAVAEEFSNKNIVEKALSLELYNCKTEQEVLQKTINNKDLVDLWNAVNKYFGAYSLFDLTHRKIRPFFNKWQDKNAAETFLRGVVKEYSLLGSKVILLNKEASSIMSLYEKRGEQKTGQNQEQEQKQKPKDQAPEFKNPYAPLFKKLFKARAADEKIERMVKSAIRILGAYFNFIGKLAGPNKRGIGVATIVAIMLTALGTWYLGCGIGALFALILAKMTGASILLDAAGIIISGIGTATELSTAALAKLWSLMSIPYIGWLLKTTFVLTLVASIYRTAGLIYNRIVVLIVLKAALGVVTVWRFLLELIRPKPEYPEKMLNEKINTLDLLIARMAEGGASEQLLNMRRKSLLNVPQKLILRSLGADFEEYNKLISDLGVSLTELEKLDRLKSGLKGINKQLEKTLEKDTHKRRQNMWFWSIADAIINSILFFKFGLAELCLDYYGIPGVSLLAASVFIGAFIGLAAWFFYKSGQQKIANWYIGHIITAASILALLYFIGWMPGLSTILAAGIFVILAKLGLEPLAKIIHTKMKKYVPSQYKTIKFILKEVFLVGGMALLGPLGMFPMSDFTGALNFGVSEGQYWRIISSFISTVGLFFVWYLPLSLAAVFCGIVLWAGISHHLKTTWEKWDNFKASQPRITLELGILFFVLTPVFYIVNFMAGPQAAADFLMNNTLNLWNWLLPDNFLEALRTIAVVLIGIPIISNWYPIAYYSFYYPFKLLMQLVRGAVKVGDYTYEEWLVKGAKTVERHLNEKKEKKDASTGAAAGALMPTETHQSGTTATAGAIGTEFSTTAAESVTVQEIDYTADAVKEYLAKGGYKRLVVFIDVDRTTVPDPKVPIDDMVADAIYDALKIENVDIVILSANSQASLNRRIVEPVNKKLDLESPHPRFFCYSKNGAELLENRMPDGEKVRQTTNVMRAVLSEHQIVIDEESILPRGAIFNWEKDKNYLVTVEGMTVYAFLNKEIFIEYKDSRHELAKALKEKGVEAVITGIEGIAALPVKKSDAAAKFIENRCKELVLQQEDIAVVAMDDEYMPDYLGRSLLEFALERGGKAISPTLTGMAQDIAVQAPPQGAILVNADGPSTTIATLSTIKQAFAGQTATAALAVETKTEPEEILPEEDVDDAIEAFAEQMEAESAEQHDSASKVAMMYIGERLTELKNYLRERLGLKEGGKYALILHPEPFGEEANALAAGLLSLGFKDVFRVSNMAEAKKFLDAYGNSIVAVINKLGSNIMAQLRQFLAGWEHDGDVLSNVKDTAKGINTWM